MRVVNATTEFKDMVDALYSALPVHRKIKRKYTRVNKWSSYAKDFVPREQRGNHWNGREVVDRWGQRHYLEPLTLIEKMEQLYRYWDDVDVEKALIALASNEVEDRVIGGFASRTQRQLRRAKKRGYLPRGGLFLGPAA